MRAAAIDNAGVLFGLERGLADKPLPLQEGTALFFCARTAGPAPTLVCPLADFLGGRLEHSRRL